MKIKIKLIILTQLSEMHGAGRVNWLEFDKPSELYSLVFIRHKAGETFLPGLIQIKIFLCLLLIAIFSFNNGKEKGIFKYTSIQYYNEV